MLEKAGKVIIGLDYLENLNFKESKMKNEYISKNGFDLCVNCKKETSYKTETPVEYRVNYIEGAGQLCEECGRKYEN